MQENTTIIKYSDFVVMVEQTHLPFTLAHNKMLSPYMVQQYNTIAIVEIRYTVYIIIPK